MILILAIATGMFSLVFYLAFADGFFKLMVDTIVDTSTGHIQIHKKNYLLNRDVKLVIPDTQEVLKTLDDTPNVKGYSPRVVCQGLISSPEESTSGIVYGINPTLEEKVTIIQSKLVKGEKLKADDERGVFIGVELARKLKVETGDKIVVMAQDITGKMSGAAFRVRGLFSSGSKAFDKSNLYITAEAARNLLGLKSEIHEIAIRLDGDEQKQEVQSILKNKLNNKDSGNKGKLRVETWNELMPVMSVMIEMFQSAKYIIFLMIYIAMAFGIANAFMMEIFDRIREFGIMMSLGTRPINIFFILLYEAVLLGLLGAVAGILLSFLVINVILGNKVYLGEGMQFMGLSSSIPIFMTSQALWQCFTGTLITVILAAMYPAAKAASFKPVEAMRHV